MKLILIFAFFIVLADLNVIGGVLGAIAIFALIAPNRLQINFAQMLIIFASILFMFKLVMRMEKFKDMGELSGNWVSKINHNKYTCVSLNSNLFCFKL